MTTLEREIFLTRNDIRCCESVLHVMDEAPEIESPKYRRYCGTREEVEGRLREHKIRLIELEEKYRDSKHL